MSKTMRKLYHLLLVTVLLTLLSACGTQDSTSAGSAASQNTISNDNVNLSWAPPSTRADGSYLPITELAGYRVYMGTSDNNLKPLVDLNDETITSYTVSDLPAGSYYFSVSAYDMNGLESGFSQVVLIQLS